MGTLTTQQSVTIALDAIVTDKRLQNRNVGMQKFKEYSDGKRYKGHIADLSRSMRTKGQLTPLLVVASDEGCQWALAEGADRAHPVPSKFFLVDGHHRLEALQRVGIPTALVTVLPGLGFLDALDACRLSNQDIVQGMSPDERTENAWSAMNQERDTYRRLAVTEAAEVLGVSGSTIKRFRAAVRQDGIDAGKIDTNASKEKIDMQLLAYWGRAARKHLAVVSWRTHKQARRKPSSPASAAAMRHKIKMAVVQTVLGTDGEYDPTDVLRALVELGEHAQRPNAIEYLINKFKPKISQPVLGDDNDDDGMEDLEYARLQDAVAALNTQRYAEPQAGSTKPIAEL